MVDMTSRAKVWHRLYAAVLVFVMLGLPGRWFDQDCHRSGLLAHAMGMVAQGDSHEGHSETNHPDPAHSDCLCWLTWGPQPSLELVSQPMPQGASCAGLFDSEHLPGCRSVLPPSRGPPVIRV